jgi:hypothetical protein
MKFKTAELEGLLLDKAVVMALGGTVYARFPAQMSDTYGLGWEFQQTGHDGIDKEPFRPTTAWAHGGPLRDKYQINVWEDSSGIFAAVYEKGGIVRRHAGRTALEAICRAFVASVQGTEIEMPT